MNRRTFVETVGGLGMMAAEPPAGERRTGFYLLETYYLRHSTQAPRIHEFMRQGLLPALSKLHGGAKIFLEAVVASHMPQYAVVLGLRSIEELSTLRARLREDTAFQKAFSAWESGPEPPYEHFSQVLLKAADYSPEIEPSVPSAKPRIFELRTYHAPTWRQLAALHERFAGPEIRIFHRSGVHPILYSETVIGPNMPNLTYLTPFATLADREKAWDTFSSDPEWIKVRRESIDAYGQITAVIQIALYKATPYSPIR